ncbi:MAG TPA: outer membrane protein assembly factor BamD [Devosiaceae bacterium]
MTFNTFAGYSSRAAQVLAVGLLVMSLAACDLFSAPKVREEQIIPPETLYLSALNDMDGQRYLTAITTLEKLDRQHPYSDYAEKSKLMEAYANYRIGKFDDAISAVDRYMALYPNSKEVPYVLWIKGTAYYAQIKDITRDQQISQNAIDTYKLLISNYPTSDYAKDASDKLLVAVDQLAGKEMSVGRYYLGNGQYLAGINRFRVVVEQYQTSTHIEEALFRLTEGYLSLGLIGEAQTAASVLGHNYPSSSWYKEAFDLLAKQGLQPQVVDGNWIADSQKKK